MKKFLVVALMALAFNAARAQDSRATTQQCDELAALAIDELGRLRVLFRDLEAAERELSSGQKTLDGQLDQMLALVSQGNPPPPGRVASVLDSYRSAQQRTDDARCAVDRVSNGIDATLAALEAILTVQEMLICEDSGAPSGGGVPGAPRPTSGQPGAVPPPLPGVGAGTGTGAGLAVDRGSSEWGCSWHAAKKDLGIASNNRESRYNIELDACKRLCQDDFKDWCKSLEYVWAKPKPDGTPTSYCYFSEGRAGEQGLALSAQPGMEYHDFECGGAGTATGVGTGTGADIGTGTGTGTSTGLPVDRRLSEWRCSWHPAKKDLGIASNNRETRYNIELDGCKRLCRNDFKDWCRSLEYVWAKPKPDGTPGSYCYFSEGRAGEQGLSLSAQPGMEYHDFDCVLIEAAAQRPSSGAATPSARGEIIGWALDYGRWDVKGSEITATPANDGYTSYFVGPREMLGNWLAKTALSFDKKSWGGDYYGPDEYDAYGDVVLSNGDMKARYDLDNLHSGAWESHSIQLASSEWRLSGGARTMSDVLTNVTDVRIRAEYGAGDDFSALRAARLK